ncbi:MAG: hypothetical protein HRU40_16970 [Saprospiraceae bacterium]|nr:hypothetical protein [Saprospiraceae bacterium]
MYQNQNYTKPKITVPKLLDQKTVVEQNYQYALKRSRGEIVSLATCYKGLNHIIQGGFESNTMLTISALSGGGKSTLAKRLVNSIIANLSSGNSPKKGIALSFNFEMLAHKTVGREIANRSKTLLSDLYSSYGKTDEKFLEELYEDHYKKLMNYPLYYVEEPQNDLVIGKTIYETWKKLCKPTGKYMIVEIDHASITKGRQNEDAKRKIDNLMETLNYTKKKIASEGGNVFYIVLSQMNRDIKHRDRIMTEELHYPISSDLFQSSTIEHFSDYILISHMPSKLNIKSYTDQKLPVYLMAEKTGEATQFIYWHLIKNREGEADRTVPMLNNLKYFDFTEISSEKFKEYHQQFMQKGIVTK